MDVIVVTASKVMAPYKLEHSNVTVEFVALIITLRITYVPWRWMAYSLQKH
jgi:hypothetical protein